MINPYLKVSLEPAWQRLRRWRLLCRTALWLCAAALSGWILFHTAAGIPSPGTLGIWLLATLLGLALITFLWLFGKPDYRALARKIEARHPSLDGRLLTAVDVDPGSDEPAFIQEILLQQTIQHGLDHDWKSLVSPRRLDAVQAVSLLAAGACAAIFLTAPSPPVPATIAALPVAEDTVKLSGGVEVTPGDTSIEKGSSLLAMVRFTQAVPSTVELVTGDTPETEKRHLLVRSLNDPIFGGSVTEVREDFRYRIDYDGQRTRDFTVKVFEYPKLERSDITLTYPSWTQLPEKRTEDTRRASAVEGTRLRLDLQLNKPVASAVLKPRDKGAADVPLGVDPQKATAILTDFPLTSSQTYELVLTDADQRVNKVSSVFTFEVLPNLPPVIKLASPKGDQRPSALEEMVFTGTVSDDFGVLAWGMALTHGGGEPALVELGRDGPAAAPQSFQHLLRLEELKAKPDDLISWYVWADDMGPDGKPRRTQTDLFFGEVRPFEEIFRQGEEAAGGAPPPPPGEGGAGEQAAKLAELQKQIINATWKLQRTGSPPVADVGLVKNSQADALEQAAEAAAEGSEDPRVAAGWKAAQDAMKQAGAELETAEKQPAPLTPALAAEQKAYQALLAVGAREIRISKSQSPPGPPSSAAEQQRQMELDEMDLTKEENRYQMEKEAQAPQEAAQREQRQVVNRLQELARRQEEVNERLKELQTALQAEQTEEQRKELERELKRLEEEQREMLADVDELNQRMEKPENQEQLAQEKQELEQARKNVQEAAKAAAEGNVAQALSSGTRAQRQLEEMREDLRKKSSSAFNEEMRDLRSEARDLANRQEKVTEQLEQLENPKQRTLSDTPDQEVAQQQLADQQKRTQALTQKATELSESAEGSEPLVSRQLYDTMRKFAQEDAASVKDTQQKLLAEGRMTRQFMEELNELQQNQAGGKALEMTSSLLEQDLLDEAKSGAKGAEASIEDFKSGIERAAENVLGDDTEALKRADRELEQLTKDLAREMAAAGGSADLQSAPATGSNPTEPGTPGNPSESKAPGQGQAPGETPANSETAAAAGEGKSDQPGKGQGQSPGEGETPGPPGKPATAQAKGEGQGPGEGEPSPESQGDGKGQGKAPGQGQGKGKSEAQTASTAQGEGQGKGQGEAEGQGKGEGEGDGEGEGQGEPPPGQQAGKGKGQGQGQGPGKGQGEGEPGEGEGQGDPTSPGSDRGTRIAGGRGGSAAPMTGDGYAPWSDRLREVEEIVDFPDLRNNIANARERAREMRVEMKRDLKKPDWAVVQAEVMTPLVEVRQRLKEELAKRTSGESLVPIDRDPVPGRYAEQVRRYYEQLGKEP